MTPARAPVIPPRTPDDAPPEWSLEELADRFSVHSAVALRRTPHLTRSEKQAHALAALATRAVLLERLDQAGWDLAVAAIRAGLTIDETAASMGIHPTGLLVYLAAGINQRWPAGTECDEELHAEVMRIIADATPDGPT